MTARPDEPAAADVQLARGALTPTGQTTGRATRFDPPGHRAGVDPNPGGRGSRDDEPAAVGDHVRPPDP